VTSRDDDFRVRPGRVRDGDARSFIGQVERAARKLARREVDQAGRKLAQERGKSFYVPESGERISGTYRQSVQLVSGKYALVERSCEFTLVPWRPVIEKELGKQVSGLVRGDGISWELGRQRGLGIGM